MLLAPGIGYSYLNVTCSDILQGQVLFKKVKQHTESQTVCKEIKKGNLYLKNHTMTGSLKIGSNAMKQYCNSQDF